MRYPVLSRPILNPWDKSAYLFYQNFLTDPFDVIKFRGKIHTRDYLSSTFSLYLLTKSAEAISKSRLKFDSKYMHMN